jgi:hypothetical protein
MENVVWTYLCQLLIDIKEDLKFLIITEGSVEDKRFKKDFYDLPVSATFENVTWYTEKTRLAIFGTDHEGDR